MKFLVSALAAAGAALTLLPSAQAADSQLLTALSTCRATYFDAIAKDKNIPESLKIRDGSRAYLKVEKQPLDVVMFEKPFKDSGLTVTGYVFNDEIIRYVGVPDMHTHFWGLIVKEDWKSVVDKLKGIDWEAVDSRHMSAHANRMLRKNDEKEWKAYTHPQNYEYPDLSASERAFHVQPYENQTMVFCGMLSAGAPEEAIIADVRPDLLYGEQKVPIREEQIVKDSEKAKAKTPIEPGAQMPANHPKIDMENLPAGHPKIDGKQELPAGHPDISGAQKPAAK